MLKSEMHFNSIWNIWVPNDPNSFLQYHNQQQQQEIEIENAPKRSKLVN